jgi:hypothetical protein
MEWNRLRCCACVSACKITNHSKLFPSSKAAGRSESHSATTPPLYILEKWSDDAAGPKLATAKAILLKCLAGDCSAAVARVAFVEAPREADIFIKTAPRPATGKLERWGKSKARRPSGGLARTHWPSRAFGSSVRRLSSSAKPSGVPNSKRRYIARRLLIRMPATLSIVTPN